MMPFEILAELLVRNFVKIYLEFVFMNEFCYSQLKETLD
jgi:hypothetical protein